MVKNNRLNMGKLCAFIILVLYCVSLAPSFMFHEHSDTHNHNHDGLSHCKSLTETLNQHLDCPHEHHLSKLKENCFLCKHCTVYDHLFSVHIVESNNRLIIEKDYELCEKLNLQEFINYLNKSPPVLI